MKSISNFITEGLTKKQASIVGELIATMFKAETNLTIDQIVSMFKNVDLDVIADIEDYIYNINKKEFLPYYADADSILAAKNNEELHTKIIRQLSEYLKNLA